VATYGIQISRQKTIENFKDYYDKNIEKSVLKFHIFWREI
jgi:hypothetical protein